VSARRELTIPSRDGLPLAATVYDPEGLARATVLVAPAMGVKRGFYARFGLFLARQGLAVVTFDYRGIGGSTGAGEAHLAQWGEDDLAAMIAWSSARPAASSRLALVAHSVSAQLLGFAANNRRPDAVMLVAPQSGYWQLWDGWQRARIVWAWYVAIPFAVRRHGKVPAGRLGEELPGAVAREWARWGRHPGHASAFAPDGRAGYARVTAPILTYSVADDALAPPRAVAAILSWYEGTAPIHRVLRPAEFGLPAIGHFGFFRSPFATSLWPEAAAWLAGDNTYSARAIAANARP
jgi:predicted alpha/beta hydrolase